MRSKDLEFRQIGVNQGITHLFYYYNGGKKNVCYTISVVISKLHCT